MSENILMRHIITPIFAVIFLMTVGCSLDDNSHGYTSTYVQQSDFAGTYVEEWIESVDYEDGYSTFVVMDSDSWEMLIYYPNINSSSNYISYSKKLTVEDGIVKIYLNEVAVTSDEEVIDDLLLLVIAPRSGTWANDCELYIDDESVESNGITYKQ